MFDINDLYDSVNDKPLSTEFPLIPVGVYPAVIQPPKDNEWIVKITSKEVGKPDSYKVNVAAKLEGPVPNYNGPTNVRGELWLDIDDNGKLAQGDGENVSLGRLFAAAGVNDPSLKLMERFNGLVGKRVRVTIRHEQDRRDPAKFWAKIVGYQAA